MSDQRVGQNSAHTKNDILDLIEIGLISFNFHLIHTNNAVIEQQQQEQTIPRTLDYSFIEFNPEIKWNKNRGVACRG